ncbi:M13 family metallopeptidase [Legionella micdadei]|uniref:Endopeptidase n=1 Tax=Legionella micdadei TaxID=451 RepID=A0A098GJS8_LEGMI|nr:M13 family metallopeptidase [Legionella micdadei]ARG98654.1 metallopeptidase [Legionella micdadei]ARH01367.1 metallopeptidase [Legionella micdadei]KTD28861.1 metallopeptidase PepO, peptidase, M13 family transporter [Legionella micdadei]NSL17073.1 M13 family metallopeptidase [Legionella micdadei]CEG62240.1 Metallopeptidase PepO, peptidase, M13 family [Legionella micdadei]
MRYILATFTAILSFSSLAVNVPITNDGNNNNPVEALHLDWLDTSASPTTDFFAYANGTWQKKNPIPPEYATWGSFNILQEKVQDRIHQMLIAAANNKNAAPGSIEQKVGDFYFSGMDEESINKLGIEPLLSEFQRIAAINNLADLQQVITHLQLIGVDALFSFGSMQDFKNSQEMIGAAGQGGLGLPDRDYYLKEDKKFQQIRAAYVQHIGKMFELLGDKPDQATKEAATVMNIETILAKASMSQIEQRDPNAVYHMMDLQQLEQVTPNFSWSQYLSALGQPSIKHINLTTPEFFKVMNTQLQAIPLADWKTYLRWHLIDAFASYLSKPFVDQNFKMVSALTGTKKLLPRWKRVVNTENGALGFAIGKLYVEKYFPPASKQAALEILHDIRQALKQDLQTLSWMTPETRQAALKKLALMEDRVGYPDKWWDYSTLKVDRGPYVLNVIRANEFLNKRDLNKIGKPVDRSEWAMPPQTINAYYDPSMNNLNIPAGILQPPFFDPSAPAAVNYGAIGFVMGHEMTHGFDDQGAKFDGHGNLKNWWTEADLKKFQAATNCIVEQFSKYKVDGDLPVQGKLVVGEATADLGGLTLAYHAFHNSKYYKEAKTINSITPDQQFFLGTAHVWASNIRPEQVRNLVTTDPHPPMIYRVNGTLSNMPQFQAAFSVPDKSIMVNATRCVIW